MSDVLMPLADLAAYGCEADDAEIRYYQKRLEEHDAKIVEDAIKEYKEAFRLACHNLILANHNLFGGNPVEEIKSNAVVFTEEYYRELKETQEMFLEMAKE